jgi:hypothetical protein
MTRCNSSTFLFARPNVPSCNHEQMLAVNCPRAQNTSPACTHLYHPWPALVVHGVCKTYPLLRQFSGTLVLAVPQQFDDSSLVGRKTGDFLDDFADEGGSLGESALAAGDTGRRGQDGDFLYTMALVSSGQSSSKVLQSSRRDLSDLGGRAGGCIA